MSAIPPVPLGPYSLLAEIHKCLDGVEWSGDTLEQIADLMRANGYEIREPDDDYHTEEPSVVDELLALERSTRYLDGTYCRECGGMMRGDHHLDPEDDEDHQAVAEEEPSE